MENKTNWRVESWDGLDTLRESAPYRLRVFMAKACVRRVCSRPRLGWMNGVKVALGSRGMTLETARQCVTNTNEGRVDVHMEVIENDCHVCWFLCCV